MTRPVPADWLDQRRRADHRARERASGLIEELTQTLRELLTDHEDGAVSVIDVGAGTGSNQAWLAPRLAVPQRWTLLDHDAQLLDAASPTGEESEKPEESEGSEKSEVRETTRVLGTVEDLPALTDGDQVQLVTCSALLDLLTLAEAQVLADAISGPAAGDQVAALLSLTVTGTVEITPSHPADTTITEAFDAHQRREGLLGPDGAHTVAQLLRDRGAEVTLAATDWALGAADAALIRRYLSDRAEVAVEHDPSLAELAQAWVSSRENQLSQGELQVSVGHVDLMSLPVTSTQ